MFSVSSRILLSVVLAGNACLAAFARVSPPELRHTEPGLEKAVKWKWTAAPSNPKNWGLELPVIPHGPDTSSAHNPLASSRTYTVKRGDALILIGKKFNVTVRQLKVFNGLKSDLIRIGQVLKIPTPSEAQRIAPTPVKPSEEEIAPVSAARTEQNNVLLQVFLDRQQFSTGPIDGNADALFLKVLHLYQGAHPATKEFAALMDAARKAVPEVFTTYTLKPQDFRFITPPKARPTSKTKARSVNKAATKTPVGEPPWTYEELSSAPTLVYRSPWEFVAERFHCEEAFLRSLNGHLKTAPLAGTKFRVPNVVPFEIEKPLVEPLQPAAQAGAPVTAAVLDLSLIAIYRGDALVAVMPMAVARPGLRGRGTWTIHDAIPRPRLVTRQVLTDPPEPRRSWFDGSSATPTPTPPPPVLPESDLAAGPNNPAGVVWIKLSKSDTTGPPPYGLHGTSIPDQMTTHESIGWLRVANWNIVRAVHLLPVGTPLEWKSSTTAPL